MAFVVDEPVPLPQTTEGSPVRSLIVLDLAL